MSSCLKSYTHASFARNISAAVPKPTKCGSRFGTSSYFRWDARTSRDRFKDRYLAYKTDEFVYAIIEEYELKKIVREGLNRPEGLSPNRLPCSFDQNFHVCILICFQE